MKRTIARAGSYAATVLFASASMLAVSPAIVQADQIAVADEGGRASGPAVTSDVADEQVDEALSMFGEGASAAVAADASPSAAQSGSVQLFSGAGRLDTAAQQALAAYETSECVVIVGDSGWPDALSAAGLCGALDAPMLITAKSELSKEPENAIKQLGAKKAIVIGSENSVSADTYRELEDLGLSCERLYGADRYATNLAIYNYGLEHDLWSPEFLVVASGEKFADALSLSPVAFVKKAPVFLTGADGFFTDGQQDSLLSGARKQGLFRRVVIAGAQNSVSDEAEGFAIAVSRRATGGKPCVERLAGAGRYETTVKVAEWAVANRILSWDGAAFSSGEIPYDALAGSPLQGKSGSVLLLANDTSGAGDVAAAHRSAMRSVKFFGGPASVSGAVRADIVSKLGIAAIRYSSYDISLEDLLAIERKQTPQHSEEDLLTYLDPSKFTYGEPAYYQFAIVSDGYSGKVTAAQIDAYIEQAAPVYEEKYGRASSMRGLGSAIIEASRLHNVNEVYLLAHAILESACGCSQLATGTVKGYEGYYNYFGIGAYDADPNNGGAALAKQANWNSPAAAIKGAAQWISSNYIHSVSTSSGQQNTLYKMRWDAQRAASSGSAWHQYATATHWAYGIATIMGKFYEAQDMGMDETGLTFDYPVFL